MKEHVNFYENIEEANMRLRKTTVMYDGEPYFIYAISNHATDGVFRAYLIPIGYSIPDKPPLPNPNHVISGLPATHPSIGTEIDAWLKTEDGKKSKIIRKHLNSPKFNKFRPFPLGMCNFGTKTYYIERQPNRKTEQGLTRTMLDVSPINIAATTENSGGGMYYEIDMFHPAFRDCVLGAHPTAQECLAALLDPSIANKAAAFSREFALVRGPIGMLFLAYKSDVIGVMPNNDFSSLKLGREFKHVKEAVQDLNIFDSVAV